MNNIPNPDSWMDVFTIIAATAMVAVPSWLAARAGKTIKKVQDQVVNGHKTPMRADIDEIRGTLSFIKSDVHHVKTQLSQIQTELHAERTERMRLDERFEKHRRSEVDL